RGRGVRDTRGELSGSVRPGKGVRDRPRPRAASFSSLCVAPAGMRNDGACLERAVGIAPPLIEVRSGRCGMQRKPEQGHQVGIGLLLAGSDAFKELADEIAAAHQRWEAAGGDAATLEWARRLAELAAWWCGRLEGEADAV